MPFTIHRCGGLIYHTADGLAALPGAVHGFSTRTGGISTGEVESLNLRGSGFCRDTAEHVRENYHRFCSAVGLDEQRLVLAKQVHEDTVRRVTEADAGKGLWREIDYRADALITDVPGLPLVVFSADCINILLCDSRTGAVGAVHAGWRGTALQITAKAVGEMGRCFGTRPEDIRAAIGAGIGQCCFETDGDVPTAMEKAMGSAAEPFLRRTGEKWHVDLKGLNRCQLTAAGVPAEQIEVSALCTACHPEWYWSHRKMGDRRGVQAAAIMRR